LIFHRRPTAPHILTRSCSWIQLTLLQLKCQAHCPTSVIIRTVPSHLVPSTQAGTDALGFRPGGAREYTPLGEGYTPLGDEWPITRRFDYPLPGPAGKPAPAGSRWSADGGMTECARFLSLWFESSVLPVAFFLGLLLVLLLHLSSVCVFVLL
jgi:hypothetical protein